MNGTNRGTVETGKKKRRGERVNRQTVVLFFITGTNNVLCCLSPLNTKSNNH